MNILYLCTYYHRAMIFRDAMNSLEKLGNTVIAFNAVATHTTIDDKYKGIMDSKVVHKECFNKNDRYIYFLKQKKISYAIAKSIDLKNIELVHSHTLFNGGWAARSIKKKYNIPYIVSVRNTDINSFLRYPFFKYVARKIVNDSCGVQFLSVAYKEKFVELCFLKDRHIVDSKCSVIANGVEEFWLNNIAEAKEIKDKDTVTLLCVGKIDKNKNMESVLAAADILEQRRVSVKITLIGQILDEELYGKLKENDKVTLVPYLTKEELIHYYRSNDIFVMPSFHESFGRVYVEAMSQGIPVIYTRGQGFDGIFENGEVGYAVSANNPKEIADAVEKTVNNYYEISNNCIRNCSYFNWNDVGRQLDAFYRKSLATEER